MAEVHRDVYVRGVFPEVKAVIWAKSEKIGETASSSFTEVLRNDMHFHNMVVTILTEQRHGAYLVEIFNTKNELVMAYRVV